MEERIESDGPSPNPSDQDEQEELEEEIEQMDRPLGAEDHTTAEEGLEGDSLDDDSHGRSPTAADAGQRSRRRSSRRTSPTTSPSFWANPGSRRASWRPKTRPCTFGTRRRAPPTIPTTTSTNELSYPRSNARQRIGDCRSNGESKSGCSRSAHARTSATAGVSSSGGTRQVQLYLRSSSSWK